MTKTPPDFPASSGSEEAIQGVGQETDQGFGQAESQQVDFRCTNCGAPMTWDPEVDALSCEYCGSVVPVPRGEGLVLERALSATDSSARGFGAELLVSNCKNCGAKVSFDESSTSEDCVYCGSSSVLSQEANRNALRPESLIPLDLTRKEVQQQFHSWAARLWFRPSALKTTKAVRATGIYVPFWTFDCGVHSDWSADSGTYYYVSVPHTVMVNGKPQVQMRQERRTRWSPAWGERDDSFDDLLVPASKGLPRKSLDRLGDFETSALVPYRPEYLAGWRAEEYELDLEAGWELAQDRVEEIQRSRCSSDVPGDTQRNLRVSNRVRDIRWKHILLPIWSMQYNLGGKTYTALVNGQTGRVVGDAPYSFLKIAGLVLLIIAVVLFFLFAIPAFAGAAALAS
ncbi:MAG: DNA-directed RNA polymerase subunit RPC12/RpoP [Planctomycetota bacterium]